MNQELLDECPQGDLLQQIDEAIGGAIEEVARRWLPRDLSKVVRQNAIRLIGEEIRPTQEVKNE